VVCTVSAVRRFGDDVAGIVDDVGVVAGAANQPVHRIRAAVVQHVVASAASDCVGPNVAGEGEVAGTD